jgi:hypothetical protein
MDGFLSFRFEITIYGIASIQISKSCYKLYWRYWPLIKHLKMPEGRFYLE